MADTVETESEGKNNNAVFSVIGREVEVDGSKKIIMGRRSEHKLPGGSERARPRTIEPIHKLNARTKHNVAET